MSNHDDLDELDMELQDDGFSGLDDEIGTSDFDADMQDDDGLEIPYDGAEDLDADAALEAELAGDAAEEITPSSDAQPAGQSFLASTAGKAAVGGGVFVVAMLGMFGYAMLKGGASDPQDGGPQLAMGDPWGKPIAQAPVEPQASEAPVVEQVAQVQQPKAAAPQPAGNGAVQQALARLNNPQALARESVEVTSAEPAPAPQAVAPAASVPSVESLEHIKAEILAAVKTEVARAGQPAEVPAETAEILKALQGEINQLRQELSEQNAAKAEAAEAKKAAETGPRAGRSRLKGYQIVNATNDGKMSVVKTPRGSTIVLFEGETFLVDGRSTKVGPILEDGKLLLAGDKGFIDTELEAAPKSKPRPAAAAKPKAEPAPTGETVTQVVIKGDQVVQRVMPAESSPSAVVTRHGAVVAKPKPAQGWKLNAAMAQGFLVKNPRGEFKLVRAGDMIEGVGIVDSLDNNGNLRVGIYKIERE